MRVIVVGAGVTGLTAAWRLRDRAEVVVIEASDRVGGKLLTEEVGGLALESGADAFLGRDPYPRRLCDELGLDLVGPDTLGARIFWEGTLHPIPDGVVLGVPTRIRPLLRSSLISGPGALRAAADLVLPGRVDVAASTVGDAVRRRLGREIAERLVDPLLTGVYAGDIDRLGAAEAVPLLAAAAGSSRSLIRGVRTATARTDGEQAPLFLTVRQGLSRLAESLAEPLDVRLSTSARAIRSDDAGCVVDLRGPDGEDALHADAVLVATPAYTAADLLAEEVPDAVAPLRAIPYASVVVATLVLPQGTRLPPGSGMLVPRQERRVVKAATWVTQKWGRATDEVVVRVSAGSIGEEVRLDDDDLIARVRAELREIAGVDGEPRATKVTRWPRSLPQYEVGHADRLRRIEAALAARPRILLAGAAYRGLGIAACVRQGEEAAETVLARGS